MHTAWAFATKTMTNPKNTFLTVILSKLCACIWLRIHSWQRAWLHFPQIFCGNRDEESPPLKPWMQLWRGQEGARLHLLYCEKFQQASYCWPCGCYHSPKMGKPHGEEFQYQWLAECPLLWKNVPVSAVVNSPQDQLDFPNDYSFITFLKGDGGEEDWLVFLHLPTSTRMLASKINHGKNTWTLQSTAQT